MPSGAAGKPPASLCGNSVVGRLRAASKKWLREAGRPTAGELEHVLAEVTQRRRDLEASKRKLADFLRSSPDGLRIVWPGEPAAHYLAVAVMTAYETEKPSFPGFEEGSIVEVSRSRGIVLVSPPPASGEPDAPEDGG